MAEPLYHGYVSMQARGLLSLPKEVRQRHRLDSPGAQVEITERGDGVLEIRPQVAIPASQTWFWTEDWQRREREASEGLAAGRFTDHDGVDSFLADLDT